MAEENLTLFLHCFNKGHETLQVTAIHVITDLLTTHPSLLSTQDAEANLQKPILKVFAKGVKAQHTPEVQLAAIAALCKLMLTSIIDDKDLLKQIVTCYFDPATKDNAGIRQALSYFLPVYCHSRRENMERMARIAAGVMHTLVDLSEELDESEEMVGLSTVGNMLVDWTDARKIVVQYEASVSWDETGKKEIKAINGDIHLDLAESLLEQAMSHGCSSKLALTMDKIAMLMPSPEEHKKALIAMLGKLYITVNSSFDKLQTINTSVTEAVVDKLASDAGSRNALNKLHLALTKAMGEAGKPKKSLDKTLAPDADDGLTVMDGHEGEESVRANEEDVKLEMIEDEGVTDTKDPLLEELLDDEDEDL